MYICNAVNFATPTKKIFFLLNLKRFCKLFHLNSFVTFVIYKCNDMIEDQTVYKTQVKDPFIETAKFATLSVQAAEPPCVYLPLIRKILPTMHHNLNL